MARNVGIATAPETGPANTVVEASVASWIVVVPAAVTVGFAIVMTEVADEMVWDVTVPTRDQALPLATLRVLVDVS
jgi:hypothetical protein